MRSNIKFEIYMINIRAIPDIKVNLSKLSLSYIRSNNKAISSNRTKRFRGTL